RQRGRRLQQLGGARVAARGRQERTEQRAQVGGPVAGGGALAGRALVSRQLHLGEHQFHHLGQQVRLVAHVVIQRHRRDAQLLAEAAEAGRRQPLAVGQLQGQRHDAAPRDRFLRRTNYVAELYVV